MNTNMLCDVVLRPIAPITMLKHYMAQPQMPFLQCIIN